jgi:putative hydrolase of the HAD superfamily
MFIKPTLILDADDTLWENEAYYEQAIADFADLMAAQGFDRLAAQYMAEVVDHVRVSLVGYGPQEFARSLAIAYGRLCRRHARPVVPEVADAVWRIGQALTEHPVALLDGVAEALPRLGRRCRLLLLTKGDCEVQQDKLARSGLASFFEGVHVVAEKDAGVLSQLVADYGLRPEQTWMVGNSPRSDINPALEAGLGAVYIPRPNTWELEREAIADPARVTVLGSFGELVPFAAEHFAGSSALYQEERESSDLPEGAKVYCTG